MAASDSVLLALIASALAIFGQDGKPGGVPFVATSDGAVHAMLKLADVKRSDVVFDLGSGDGRIPIAAAKDFGARGVGIEIDPRLVRRASENARKAGVEGLVRFEEKDLFEADIRSATVVTLFLREDFNLRLRPKLLKELKPGARIISNTFDMYDWKPDKQLVVDDPTSELFNRKLYLWVVPKK